MHISHFSFANLYVSLGNIFLNFSTYRNLHEFPPNPSIRKCEHCGFVRHDYTPEVVTSSPNKHEEMLRKHDSLQSSSFLHMTANGFFPSSTIFIFLFTIHQRQLSNLHDLSYRCFVSQSSEFFLHNHLCCF